MCVCVRVAGRRGERIIYIYICEEREKKNVGQFLPYCREIYVLGRVYSSNMGRKGRKFTKSPPRTRRKEKKNTFWASQFSARLRNVVLCSRAN